MSAEVGQKRTLEEIGDYDDEFDDEFDDDDAGWDDNDSENEPPLKKQKLSNETNIVADDVDDLYMNTNTNTNDSNELVSKNDSNSYECIILISGSITKEQLMNSFFKQLLENNFQIEDNENIKQFSMTNDELERLFFETPNSSINMCDIAEIGLFDEFNKNKSNYAIIIKGNKNNIISFAKTYHKNKQFYFTLNNEDFTFKFNLLFSIQMQHNIFWTETIKRNNSGILSANHSKETEETMNKFHEEMLLQQEIENYSQNIGCCCWPIIMSQHDKYGERYIQLIEDIGINELSRNCFQKAIERHLNIYNGKYIDIKTPMKEIFEFMGDVLRTEKKCDKEIPKNFTCGMCESKFRNLKTGEKKKKDKHDGKKKIKIVLTDQDRYCEICDCAVPKKEFNWKQHIDGKKHKKKAVMLI